MGENILRRLPQAFPVRKTVTEQLEALSARTGIAVETIRRTAKGETFPGLDKLEKIAQGLHVHAYELLRPYGIADTQEERDQAREQSELQRHRHEPHPRAR